MKKNSLFASFFLATLTIVGCSSIESSKPAIKNEIIHEIKNNTIDLGGSLSNSVKLKLGFSGFSTKSVVPGFGSYSGLPPNLANSKLEIKLHKYPTGTPIGSIPSPKARFELGPEVFYYPLSNMATSSAPLLIQGLQFGYDYYLSARVYIDFVFLPNNIIHVDVDNAININKITFSKGQASDANIQIGDYIKVGTDTTEYKVINFTTGGVFVSPNLDNMANGINQDIQIKRNIVGIGDSGVNALSLNGMAIDGDALGGGTIPAETSGSSNEFEEFISINNQGVLTINHDVGNNNQWDMNIQLMKDTTLTYNNNAQISVTQEVTKPIDLISYYLPTEIEKIASVSYANPQKNPTAMISDSGNINFAWESNDGISDDIRIKSYVEATKTWSAETLVNTANTIGDQINPSMAYDENDNFIVAWEDKNSSPSSINFQRYNAAVSPQGSNQIVAYYSYGRSFPKVGVSRTSGQNFIIVWKQDESFLTTPNTDVYGQIFAPDGSPLAEPFKINGASTGDQAPSHVSVDDNGNFLVSWVDFNTSKAYFRLYNNSGVPNGIPISLSDTMGISEAPKHDFDSFGDFVVVGRESFGIYVQKFSGSGQKIGNRVSIDSTIESFPESNELNIKVAKNGSSVVSWIGGSSSGKAKFVPLTRDLEIDDDPKMLNYSSNFLAVKTLNTSINEKGDLLAAWTVDHDSTIHPTNNQVFYRKFSKVRKKY